MIYILTSILVLLISVFLFKKAAGSLSFFKPNLISYVFYYNIIAQMLVAVVLAVLSIDNHYVISRVDMEVRYNAWLAVLYTMLVFPFGMLLSKLLFANNTTMKKLLESYVASPILVKGWSGNSLKYSIWCFTIIAVVSCVYAFISIGYFPFTKALLTNSSDLAVTRISASRDFSGNIYVRNLLALVLMPIVSYAWVFYYLNSKSIQNLFMVYLSVFFALSILYYDFSKSPILWYILSFIFVYYYAVGKFYLWHLVGLVAVTFIGLVVMYSLSGVSISDFASYNTGPVGRVILGQAAGLFIMFDIFPDQYEFIGLSSLSHFLSNLFGYEYLDRAARIAMTYFRPEAVAEGRAGVMNSMFIAEAWANFGLFGVLLSPLWVGFLLQTLYIFFLKSPKNPIYLSFFVTFSIGGSVTGGFNDYIYNPSVVIMAIFFSMIVGLALFFKVFATSNKLRDDKF